MLDKYEEKIFFLSCKESYFNFAIYIISGHILKVTFPTSSTRRDNDIICVVWELLPREMTRHYISGQAILKRNLATFRRTVCIFDNFMLSNCTGPGFNLKVLGEFTYNNGTSCIPFQRYFFVVACLKNCSFFILHNEKLLQRLKKYYFFSDNG